MIPDPEALAFLNGKHFSNNWMFHIAPQPRLIQRNRRLMELARGKSVLHLGCTDHPELIERKIREGRYLHSQLRVVASRLIGVDINEKGVRIMRDLGFEDIYLPSQLPIHDFDLLIVADVIEHVPDVRMFLMDLHQYNFDIMVVTTPNAYRRINRIQLRGEIINTDHRYWFSPFTLCKVLLDAGFQLDSLEFTDRPSRFNFIRNLLLKKFPLLQEGLLVIVRKKTIID
jgi:hypothetical protein